MRRRAVGTTSNAGMPQGTQVPLTPTQPNTNAFMQRQAPQVPQTNNQSEAGISALPKQQPGEAEIIIKALSARLAKLSEGATQ